MLAVLETLPSQQVETTPTVSEKYQAQIKALIEEEAKVFSQFKTAPSEALVQRIQEIWAKREELYAEWEAYISSDALEVDTCPACEGTGEVEDTEAEEVITCPTCGGDGVVDEFTPATASYQEWEKINKPLGWKFSDGWWYQSGRGGRHSLLPKTVREQYKITPRQLAILEGRLSVVDKPKPKHEQPQWMAGFRN